MRRCNAHQAGALLNGELRGVLVKECTGRCFDAIGIAAKEHGVHIHCDNLVLGIVALQLHGCDPLLELDDYHMDNSGSREAAITLIAGEKCLCKLLGDGTAAAGGAFAQGQRLHCHAAQAAEVDAGVLVKAGILRSYRSVNQRLRQLFIGCKGAILNMISAQHLTVAAEQHGSKVGLVVFQFLERRYLGKQRHQKQREPD